MDLARQGQKAWRMPPDQSWIAVRIISAEVVTEQRLVIGDDGKTLRDCKVPTFRITSQRANSEYGERPKPYIQKVPVHEITVPYSQPHADRAGYTLNSDELLAATGIRNCIGKLDQCSLETLCQLMKGQVVLADMFHSRHGDLVFDYLEDTAFREVPD